MTSIKGRLFKSLGLDWYEANDAEGFLFVVTTYKNKDHSERVLFMGIANEIKNRSAQLTREQVSELIPILQHFVDTGKLPE